MKNLLILAQKVNQEDDLLGFFVEWLREFSKHFDRVFVIVLEKGPYDLPDNVEVYSIGKETRNSKLKRAFNFLRLIVKLVPKSSGVFAHMSPIFAIAVWPFASLCDKKIVLWYLHRSVTWKLKTAEKLSDVIVTAAKESLPFKSNKIIETGHGIPSEIFNTQREWDSSASRIISIGRISRIKNYETLLEALNILKSRGINISGTIVGRPVMAADKQYFEELKSLKKNLALGSTLEFKGFASYQTVPGLYRNADIAVGLTPHGGIDKTILEAMASGCLILTSNTANQKYFGQYSDMLIFQHGDAKMLADKIETLHQMPPEEKAKLSEYLVASVRKYHDLEKTISKISDLFKFIS